MRDNFRWKEFNLAGPFAHALSFRAVFHPGLEKHLKANANAQDRAAAGNAAADEADAVHGLEFAHDGFKSADAGNHQAVGFQNVLRLGAKDYLCTCPFERPDG